MPTKTKTVSNEERQARRDADRQRTREAVRALRASDGWQKRLGLRRHLRTYSLTNQLLIAIAMPAATRVAAFKGVAVSTSGSGRRARRCCGCLDAIVRLHVLGRVAG
jgi:hypothetical protein